MRFFDDNTHSHWTPVTGGANVPALNDLLKPFGFAFGDRILNGAATMNGQAVAIASGFWVSDRIQTCARGAVTTSP